MRLTRELNPQHLKALSTYLKGHPPRRRFRIIKYLTGLVVLTVLVSATVTLLYVQSSTMSPWWFAAGPTIALLMWHPVWLAEDRKQTKLLVAGNLEECGQQEFWLEDGGFGNRTPMGSTFHKWQAVQQIEEAPDFGFVAARGHLYCIPKVADDDEATPAFMKELDRRWRRAVERGHAPDEALS